LAATGLTTTVSAKGQVILPKSVRDLLHWDAGTCLAVEQTEDGVLLKPLAAKFAPTRSEDVFGSLRYQGKPKSIDEMDAGIPRGSQAPDGRSRY
jgi:AbrB family looped-hinge helix DNA binding protein